MSSETPTCDPPSTPPVGWLRGVIVDAIDVERLGAFWQQVLGVGIAEQVPGWLQLKFGPAGSLIAFQPADPIAHAPAGSGSISKWTTSKPPPRASSDSLAD